VPGAASCKAVATNIRFPCRSPPVAAKPAALLRSFARFVHKQSWRGNPRFSEARFLRPCTGCFDQRLAMALRRQRVLLLSRLEGAGLSMAMVNLRLEHVLNGRPDRP